MAVLALTYWKFARGKVRECCVSRGVSLEDTSDFEDEGDEQIQEQGRASRGLTSSPKGTVVALQRGSPRMQDVFSMIDADGDGQITREEWQKYAFNAFDRNHDGQISKEEYLEARRPVMNSFDGPHCEIR